MPPKHLIMVVGLPRSGKTFWALNQGYPIVNPDAIRLSMHGQAFIAQAEPLVWAVARYMVESLFKAGHKTVILDACNNTEKRRKTWESNDWFRHFVIFPTSEQVCLDRVARRGVDAKNLRAAIKRMSRQHEPVIPSEMIRAEESYCVVEDWDLVWNGRFGRDK